MFTHS